MAKQMLKKSVMDILENPKLKDVFASDILFVVSSTGGGTGSGTAILMTNIIREVYTKGTVVTVGVLPTLKEALSTQLNSVEYLKELYGTMTDTTYMLYDNDRCAKSAIAMMDSVNEQVVNDMDVIRGTYQIPTRYASIDERDMLNIIGTPGRLVVAGVRDIAKRRDADNIDIEDALIDALRTAPIADLEKDGVIARTGVISALSSDLNDRFDTHIPKVLNVVGTPVEEFEHVAVNTDRHLPSNIFIVCSGMSQANDRLRKINDRIEEINALQEKAKADDSIISEIDVSKLSQKVSHTRTPAKEKEAGTDFDLKSIFSKFGI